MAEKETKAKASLQTVDRALQLIDIMAHSSNKMSVVEISKILGVTRTGAYNLLNSLMKYNFVEKDPISNKYSIGYAFMELSICYRRQYPFLFAAERGIYVLSRKYRHQINLTIYKRPGVALLLMVKSPEDIQKDMQRVALPAYVTGGGKLLMAYLPEEELEEDLAQMELQPFAKNTITDKAALRQAFAQIRENGYATEEEENFGMRGCIAFPIRDISGKVIAAISMALPLEEMKAHFDTFIADVRNAAIHVSQELGYDPYRN